MMTNNQDLARRFVACKGWRWMPGMLTTDKSRLLSGAIGRDEDDGDVFEFSNRGNGVVGSLHEFELPDLSDAATVGCILALVREAWGGKDIWVEGDHREYGDTIDEWEVFQFCGAYSCESIGIGSTYVSALLAALEAAP